MRHGDTNAVTHREFKANCEANCEITYTCTNVNARGGSRISATTMVA